MDFDAFFKKEIGRQKFYNFLRTRNKPSKSYNKVKTVKESPIGPLKMPKPNQKCLCGSNKKFKKCCERK